MTIRDAGRGTGRLSEDAVKQAALEAARRAAEASRKATADAAARKEVAPAAPPADAQKHTGRLQLQTNADFGDLPWEKIGAGAAVVAGTIGAVTTSSAYTYLKESLSVKKKVDDIQKTVSQVSTVVDAARKTGGGMNQVMAALSEKRPPSVKPLDTLGSVNSVIRVAGGLQNAVNLKADIEALKDGVTVKEATKLASDSLGVLRGVDEASKLLSRSSAGVLAKFAPGIGIAASSLDAVRRMQTLSNWNDLSTKDKVANVAYLVGDAADILGNVFPPAKAVGAGLALVGMAAENWDTVTAVAGKAADLTVKVAGAVADGARELASEAREVIKDSARTMVNGAREAASAVTNGVKNFFSGL